MRILARALTAIALVVGVTCGIAAAQALPRLTITAFTLSSDTASPQIERPFHLIVDVRVKQRISGLPGVVLPAFGTLEILGDETHVVADATGTEYRETLTVVSHRSGPAAIGSAYLDAIDARDGKPKRFLSNGLTLHVAGGIAQVKATLRPALSRAVALVIGVAIVVVLGMSVMRLRNTQPPKPHLPDAPEPEPAAEQETTPHDAVRAARDELATHPTRAGAVAVRARMWAAAGAGEGETLADVLHRPAAHDSGLREVLRAVERAAFTHDGDVAVAARDAIDAMDAYIRRRTPTA